MFDVELLLTATQPISHNDAGAGDTGNVLTFNRRKQLLEREAGDALSQEEITRFCAAHPVPAEVWEVLQHISFAEYVAASMAAELIGVYGGGDGYGLLTGVSRYEMLERKLSSAAIVSSTLPRMWSALCNSLLLPIHPAALDERLMQYWALSPSVQSAVIATCVEQARSVVSVARFWSSQAKLRSESYAKRSGAEVATGELVAPTYRAEEQPAIGTLIADVPTISSNGTRHQIVRTPAWAHLTRLLELPASYAGEGRLPLGVESIFVNGGNIKAGAKQPSNPFVLAGRARKAFPVLDLLGGVTNSFDLGESALKVSTWLVCRENRAGLPAYLAGTTQAGLSAFDMLDQITETRQATPNGEGQMIRSFEVLIPGTMVYVRCTLHDWAQQLTRGALMCAVREYMRNLFVLGGQTARGYGQMHAESLFAFDGADDDADAYEAYLRDNREQLAMWMLDGTLGAGAHICS
jgi:hypothetical protein